MSSQTFIFIGRSGAGKGTQAALLVEHLKEMDSNTDVLRLETGKQYREFVEKNFYASTLSKKINLEGGIQPAFLSIWMWSDLLIKNLQENVHLLIDGSPRRLIEAEALHSAFEFFNRERPVVVYIDVSEKWARLRLMERHRSDDNKKDITNRMLWFEKEVMPTVEYYRNNPRYRFLDINGEQPIDAVWNEIESKLNQS
jgi:adenylate kinase family enzyme